MSFISFLGFDPEFERQIVLFVELQREVKRAAKEFGFDGDMFSDTSPHDKTHDDQLAFFNVWREVDQDLRQACETLAKKMVWNAILNTPKK